MSLGEDPMNHYDKILQGVPSFAERLQQTKAAAKVGFNWYNYGTLHNFAHLKDLITPEIDRQFGSSRRIADIGAADGDLSFFLESLGYQCDIYDYPPTNMNGLKGANYVKQALSSNVGIFSVDLDSQFEFTKAYDLVFMLGILYHLKNPFYVLETLSRKVGTLFVSTRIARFPRQGGPDLSGYPMAYLVSAEECNNDATNFWIFTDAGVKRLFERTGWTISGFRNVGDVTTSNPQDMSRDERIFAVLQSRR